MVTEKEVLEFNLKHKDKAINAAKRRGININLDRPITIQDKLEWLNIYDVNPLKWKCADKVKIHEYSKEILGEDICVPLLGVYNNTKEIDWNKLPNQFVIKCNHGSGMNCIVRDKSKANKNDIFSKLNRWMKDDFTFRNGFESHYHWIDRKILIEEYKNDGHNDLIDYKFLCFNGKPIYCQVIGGRNDSTRHLNYYNMDFRLVNMCRTDFRNNPKILDAKPKQFEQMREYAFKLSNSFKFVRVDFYEINGKVYLGEMTFTPGVNHFKYANNNDNTKVGSFLKI